MRGYWLLHSPGLSPVVGPKVRPALQEPLVSDNSLTPKSAKITNRPLCLERELVSPNSAALAWLGLASFFAWSVACTLYSLIGREPEAALQDVLPLLTLCVHHQVNAMHGPCLVAHKSHL